MSHYKLEPGYTFPVRPTRDEQYQWRIDTIEPVDGGVRFVAGCCHGQEIPIPGDVLVEVSGSDTDAMAATIETHIVSMVRLYRGKSAVRHDHDHPSYDPLRRQIEALIRECDQLRAVLADKPAQDPGDALAAAEEAYLRARGWRQVPGLDVWQDPSGAKYHRERSTAIEMQRRRDREAGNG